MKRIRLLLLFIVIINITLQQHYVYADNKDNYATLELRCINISNPDKPIEVGDIFDIEVIGKQITDLYGYSINTVYDPGIMTVTDSVYNSVYDSVYSEKLNVSFSDINISSLKEVNFYSVSQSVYNDTVTENVYTPYTHNSVFEGLEKFSINTIYKGFIGSENKGIPLINLISATFNEFLKGEVKGIDVNNDVIARIRFKALKEAVIPLHPSNELSDITSGANIIIQMANSLVNKNYRMSYDITIPYGELIIGSGNHSSPKTHSFIYKKQDVEEGNDENKEKESDSSTFTLQGKVKNAFSEYSSIWETFLKYNELTKLEKTLIIIKKQREGLPKIEYELDEDEVLNIINDVSDNSNKIILEIPLNEEYKSNGISIEISLNTLVNIKNASKEVFLRCDSAIGSSQISLSSLSFESQVKNLGENVKKEFVDLVLEISKVTNKDIDTKDIIDISKAGDGIKINAYIKYGRKKQQLLNMGDWVTYIIPYQLDGQLDDAKISCLIMQKKHMVVIPIKTFTQNGQDFIIIKTLCATGTLYTLPLNCITEPDLKMEKFIPKEMKNFTQRRVFKGYADGNLYGSRPIIRSQFVVLLSRLFGMTVDERIETDFIDIQDKTWYSTETEQMKQLGWIKGYPDGTFQPDKPITAQEMAILIDRIINWNDKKEYLLDFGTPWVRISNLTEKYESLKFIFTDKNALISRNQSSIILKFLEKILGIE